MNIKKQILYGAILFCFAISNAFADQFYFGGVPHDLFQAAPRVEYVICNDAYARDCPSPPVTVELTEHLITIPLDDNKSARINSVTFSPNGVPETVVMNYPSGPDWVLNFSYLSDAHTNIVLSRGIAGEEFAVSDTASRQTSVDY